MTGRDEKMAPRITETMRLFTALLLIAAISRGHTENVYLSSGRDVTLSPNYRGDFNEIIWLVNDIKLVELELNEKQQPIYYKTFPRLNAGASLNNQTGELTIPQLTIRDSGKYKAEVKLHDLAYNYTYITLTVLDPVVTPIITNKTTENWIFLICESTSPGVTYKWQDDKGKSMSNDKTCTIPKPTEAAVTLTCIASNAVSEGRASVTIKPPGRLSVWAIAGITAGSLVFIIVMIICIKRKCCNPWKRHVSQCTRPPCCIRENAGIIGARPKTAEDLLRHVSQCTHTPCCIKYEVIACINRARPNTAEDLEIHFSQCTHTLGCLRDEENAEDNDTRPKAGEENFKPRNEGNGTVEQQDILLENIEKGNKTGSREEV